MNRVVSSALRGNGGFLVRPLVATDEDGLSALVDQATDTTLFYRFFTLSREFAHQYMKNLVTEIGAGPETAFVATVADRVVAVATYAPGGDGDAPSDRPAQVKGAQVEMSVLVYEEGRYHGIGTALLATLALDAQRKGAQSMLAQVATENRCIVKVLGELGFTSQETDFGPHTEYVLKLLAARPTS